MAWRPGHLSRMQLEERRLHFAQTYLTGKYNHRQLCAFYGISPSTLFLWKRLLRMYGLSGLKARKPPGRPRILSAQQQAQLQTWVQEAATEHGFADPTWTVPRVRDMMGLQFGIWYHRSHVFTLLKQWGFSYQKPDHRAIERKEDHIARWITTQIPEIQEKVRLGATLVFLDETGFSLKTTTRRTWATRGKTPLVKTRMNWEKLSVIGAITSTGKFFQNTVLGSFKGPHVATFLEHLLKHISGDLLIVLDNGGIHKTKAVQDVITRHPRLQLVFLPPYAPELNPIEHLWACVKQHFLGNRLSKNLQELKSKLRQVWVKVRRLNLFSYCTSGLWKTTSAKEPSDSITAAAGQ